MDALARHPLDPVVADRGGGGEPLLDVARLEDLALRRLVAPDAGVAVGLELEADRELVGSVGPLLLRLPHLGLGAHQALHVVAELVGDDVGLGEVAGGAEALLQLVVEARSM